MRESKTVSPEILAKAIQYSYNEHTGVKISFENAMETALKVYEIFGFRSSILANRLERSEMSLMYSLDKLKLVKSYKEIGYAFLGKKKKKKRWRIFNWEYRKEIFDYYEKQLESEAIADEPSREESTADFYDSLPEDVWSRKPADSLDL